MCHSKGAALKSKKIKIKIKIDGTAQPIPRAALIPFQDADVESPKYLFLQQKSSNISTRF